MKDIIGVNLEVGSRVLHATSGRYGGFQRDTLYKKGTQEYITSPIYQVIGFTANIVKLANVLTNKEKKANPLNLVVVQTLDTVK